MRITRLLLAAMVATCVGLSPTGETSVAQPNNDSPQKGQPSVDALGDPLPAGAIARLGTLRMRHQIGNVPATAISPDGKFAATVGDKELIRVWDLDGGKETQRFKGPFNFAHLMAPIFSANGSLLAAVFQDQKSDTIVIWDFPQGKERQRLSNLEWGTSAVAFADGDKTLVVLDRTGKVRRWDIATGRAEPAWQVVEHFQPTNKMGDHSYVHGALSSDGKRVALQWHYQIGYKQVPTPLVMADVNQKKILWSGEPLDDARFYHFRFSADGEVLACALQKGRVQVRQAATGKTVHDFVAAAPLAIVSSGARPIALSGDSKTLVVLDWEGAGVAGIWDLTSGKKRLEIPLGSNKLNRRWGSSAIFFPDDKRLLLSANDQMYILDTAARKETLPLPGHRASVQHLYFSEDGKTLISGNAGPKLKFPHFGGWGYPLETIAWNTATWAEDRRLSVPEAWPAQRPAAASPDHSFSVYSKDGRDLELRTFPDDKLIRVLDVRGKGIWQPQGVVSPDGKLLVVQDGTHEGGPKGAIAPTCVIDLDSGKLLGNIPMSVHRQHIVFAKSKPLAAWLTNDFQIGVFDPSQPNGVFFLKELTGKKAQVPWQPLAFSSDGQYLAEWDRRKGSAVLWDLKTRKIWRELPIRPIGNNVSAECMAFSPNDKWLAVGGVRQSEKEVQVWNIGTGKLVRTFVGHEQPVTALAWSPDGRRLASGSEDTTMLIWEVALPRL